MTNKNATCSVQANLPLSVAAVSSYLDTSLLGSTLAVLGAVDSTNNYIKTHVAALDDGFTVIAGQQMSGRGRLGRKFCSAEGGLYMSILLPAGKIAANAGDITVRAAVAVRNAIAELTGLGDEVGIKWVNDIYCGQKKICGILAERVVRKGLYDFTVLGIGVNVTTSKEAFGRRLSEIAGSVSDFCTVDFSKNQLAAAILNELEKILFVTEKEKRTEILDNYRSHSVIIGKKVYVTSGEKTSVAHVLGIDDDASLYVQYEDESTAILRSGTVSTSLIKEDDE
jgi:BirA family biotin operon repressor/biotin-[acetyl-CoA-carboxylase] ligase